MATLTGAEAERAKTARIAVIVSGQGTVPVAFRQSLAILGYSEGRNLQVDERWLPTLTDPLLDLVDELSQMKPDVVVTWGDRATQAARHATRRIPIIFVVASDPVTNLFVGSPARPEGNLTGITLNSADASRRRIELLRETMPGLSRLAVISRPENPGEARIITAVLTAARSLGVESETMTAQQPREFEGVLRKLVDHRAEAVLVLSSFDPASDRELITHAVARSGLPAIYESREFPESEGLMSYGADLADVARQAAAHVDAILRGAKPRDFPVEGPAKFELVVNATTAKALELTIPRSILVRADQIIE